MSHVMNEWSDTLAAQSWKWLLDQMDDRDLVRVAKSVKLHITGFRGANWEKCLQVARPRVVRGLLQAKTISRLKQELNTQVEKDSGLKELRELTETDLQKRLLATERPERILMALLSSPEAVVEERGGRLFGFLRDSGTLVRWQIARRQQLAKLSEQQEALRELELLRQQKVASEGEMSQLREQLAEVSNELDQLHLSIEQDHRLWEIERQSLLSRLADRDTRLQLREQQLVELRSRGNNGAEPTPDGGDTRLEALPPSRAQCPGVLLVGNISQKSGELGCFSLIQHVLPAEVYQGLADQRIVQANEIWLLTYATPLPIQRRLRREVPEKLRCFASFEELLAFADQVGDKP